MAKKILVANWKNHPESLEQVDILLRGLARRSSDFKKLSTFIAPPYAYLELVARRARTFSKLASQDISLAEKTTTGEVSAEILKSFGVRLAIIGHSERRALGETNQLVAQKIKLALRGGLLPLLCVGEHKHDAEGEHLEFIGNQIRESLYLLKKKDVAGKLIIAYEPVWAIGKRAKDAMQASDLSQMVIFIRKVLSDMFGRDTATAIPILYGGAVEAGNALELAETEVSGFLVGHQSLNALNFSKIAQALK